MSQVFPGSHGGRGGGDGDGDRDDAQAADAAAELIDESPRGSSSSASGRCCRFLVAFPSRVLPHSLAVTLGAGARAQTGPRAFAGVCAWA